MLVKCANPSCSKPFRYLRDGQLFRLEPAQPSRGSFQRIEWFWLCKECSPTVTLQVEGDKVIARPVRREPKRSEQAEGNLRLRPAS